MITAFFILCGTVIITGTALVVVLRRKFNRDKARWAARFARPLTIIHPGEWDQDDTLTTGCPCCTAQPYAVDDCTCREDCGVRWCQAIDLEIPDWLTGDGRG